MYKNRSSGKSILRDYFQENRTSRRPFLLLRISFPGRPIFIQFVPADVRAALGALHVVAAAVFLDRRAAVAAGAHFAILGIFAHPFLSVTNYELARVGLH